MTANTTSNPPVPYRILISYALDETGDWALLQGLRFSAGRSDCELHLVHAVDEPAHMTKSRTVRLTDEHLSAAQKTIGERVERVWNQSAEHSIIAHVRPGDTVDTILQAAVDVGADIIVVGTHRRAGIEKLVLGSVAEQVLKRASCPVLVAMPKDYAGLPASARIEPVCAMCVAARHETKNATYWCERHANHYEAPHLYVPRGSGRSSVMPTY